MVDFIHDYIRLYFHDALNKYSISPIFYAYPTYDKNRVEFLEVKLWPFSEFTGRRVKRFMDKEPVYIDYPEHTYFHSDNLEEIKDRLMARWGLETKPNITPF